MKRVSLVLLSLTCACSRYVTFGDSVKPPSNPPVTPPENPPSDPDPVYTSINLTWDPVTQAVDGSPATINNYTIYWGTASHSYQWSQVVTDIKGTVPHVQAGKPYYFAVTASGTVNGEFSESDYSAELAAVPPMPAKGQKAQPVVFHIPSP